MQAQDTSSLLVVPAYICDFLLWIMIPMQITIVCLAFCLLTVRFPGQDDGQNGKFPCLLLVKEGASCCLCYLHGNAEDLGLSYDLLKCFRLVHWSASCYLCKKLDFALKLNRNLLSKLKALTSNCEYPWVKVFHERSHCLFLSFSSESSFHACVLLPLDL